MAKQVVASLAGGGRAVRVVVYARISLDRDGAGLGVERQREDCLQLARERGWEVVAEFADNDISAYSGRSRPGYRALLDFMAADECDAVVAWHVDRLHRSPTELEEYISISERTSTSTVTVRAGELDLSTAAGRMVARMLGATARHESEQKSERIRRKRRQEAESGRAHGQLGYGYDASQHVIPEEAAVIREVAERILAGDTMYGIATDLNARDVPTPGSGQWHHRQVVAILVAERDGDPLPSQRAPIDTPRPLRDLVLALSGNEQRSLRSTKSLLQRVRRVADEEFEPAVEAELITALSSGAAMQAGQVARLMTRARLRGPRTRWRAANLRAMIRRGTLCGWRDFAPGERGGGPMVARGTWEPILDRDVTDRLRSILDEPHRRKRGREPRHLLSGTLVCGRCGAPLFGQQSPSEGRRYTCSSQPGLERCGRLSVAAEPVDAHIEGAVLAALASLRVRAEDPGSQSRDLVEAQRELAEIRQLREQYAKDAAAGLITRAEWFALRDALGEREATAQVVSAAIGPWRPNGLRLVPSEPSEIRRWWTDADLQAKRGVVQTLIEKVVIKPTGRGGRFDPSRVSDPVWRI